MPGEKAGSSSARRAGRRSEGPTGRSRPRASLACAQCRQRKTKASSGATVAAVRADTRQCVIDPGSNNCMSCQTLQVPCVISRDGDRRKLASREHISALRDRLHYLEGLFVGQAANREPQPQGDRRPSNGATHSLESDLDRYPSNRAEHRDNHYQPEYEQDVEFQQDSLNESYQNDGDGTNMDQVFLPAAEGGSSNDTIMPPDQTSSTVNRLTPPSEPDSARLDVDEVSSQPLFYGPTSQRYIHDRHRPENGDMCAQPWQTDTSVNPDSGTVRNVLLQTFWKAQPLSQALVDQERFEAGRSSQARSDYYSPFLEDSILACATRMSTSSDLRAFGARYAEKASSAITQELPNPNIATLQAFLLLSDYEATCGRDRLGYMYCGIGCRMAFDLGLHEDCSELITKGKMAPCEGPLRYFLFLGAYVYDKLWALYLGRPSTIPSSYLLRAQRRCNVQGWQVAPTLDAWVELSVKISEVTEILNNDAPLDGRALDELNDLDNKISAQCAALPDALVLHEDQISDLPAATYGLHIQFRGIRIVLHRLLSRALASNADIAALGRSQCVMRENAICIARLASVYQQIFGIENVITVMLDNMFVAAALLVSCVLRSQQIALAGAIPVDFAKTEEVRWIRCLADMLHNAQKHYPVTARMRSTLSALVDGTVLAGTFGVWATPSKRPLENAEMAEMNQPEPAGALSNIAFGNGMAEQQEFFFSASPFGDFRGFVPPEMDTMNMMSWMLSPMD